MNLIEKSWYQKFGITWLLLPLSALFWLIYKVRKALFSLGIKHRYQSEIPVIVVGNITVGGNGKTPMVIYLVEHLANKGKRVAVISRGYGAEPQTAPLLVKSDTPAHVCGDEPKLISERCNVPVIVCPNRTKSIQFIEQTLNVDVIISDDGLQHLAIKPALTISISDGKRKYGNGLLLPAGPLREPVSSLVNYDVIIENGGNNDLRYDLELTQYKQVLDDKVLVKGPREAYVVSAIGNPERFENTVRASGINVIERVDFRDHHRYQAQDFKRFGASAVVMTEKDAVKCRTFAKPNWYYLAVNAKLTEHAQQQLESALHSIGIK